MKKIILTLLCLTFFSHTLFANILPQSKEFQIKLEKTSYANFQQSGSEVDSELSPILAYGLNDSLSFNVELLQYEDKLDDPNETREIKLGANYFIFKQDSLNLSAIGGVRFIETEVNDDDRSGTSFYIGSNAYYTINNYLTALAGIEYFTDPSDIDYKDNFLEKIGFIFSPTEYLDVNVSYEFTNEETSYGLSYFFNF